MGKILASIFISLSLLIGIGVYEKNYVHEQFRQFSSELNTLYLKIQSQEANLEDAKGVRTSWNARKKTLHIWIPHNDISYIDYWLSEGLGYVETGNYADALSKIEVLIEITKNIPSSYDLTKENIF